MSILLRHSPFLAVQQNILQGFQLPSKTGFLIFSLVTENERTSEDQ